MPGGKLGYSVHSSRFAPGLDHPHIFRAQQVDRDAGDRRKLAACQIHGVVPTVYGMAL
jgi:hypothetical protein